MISASTSKAELTPKTISGLTVIQEDVAAEKSAENIAASSLQQNLDGVSEEIQEAKPDQKESEEETFGHHDEPAKSS